MVLINCNSSILGNVHVGKARVIESLWFLDISSIPFAYLVLMDDNMDLQCSLCLGREYDMVLIALFPVFTVDV